LPIADAPWSAGGWMFLAQGGAQVFASGLMLSLPLVTALLILNLAMGILNRASPQFSIFAVGFPLTLLAGIAMLLLLIPNLSAFLEPRFAESAAGVLRFTQALRGP
jgi:flagellar biosynthetic protein FliR